MAPKKREDGREEDDETPEFEQPPPSLLPRTVSETLARARRRKESRREAEKMGAEMIARYQAYAKTLVWVTYSEDLGN